MWFFKASRRKHPTCRSRGPNGELIERKYDYVHLQVEVLGERSRKMEVVEEIESIPHKSISFVVERDKEIQEWRETNNKEGKKVKRRRNRERTNEK